MGDLSLDALLKFLSSSGVTGTLTVVTPEGRGELDLQAGRVIGAWSQDMTGEPALRAIFATPPQGFTFETRPARPANIGAAPASPQPAGVRASLSMLTGRTIAAFDLVSRESHLRRMRFGAKAPTVLDDPAAAENVWQPAHLATLANALIGEYSADQYGGRLWNADIGDRVVSVRASGIDAPTSLVVKGGRIELSSIERLPRGDVVPFLRELLRAIYVEARRSCGEGAARRGYRAAVSRLWGAHERVLLAAMEIVEGTRPPRARLVATRGAVGGPFPLGEREHVLGRSSGGEVALAHASVSRRHARIVARAGGYVLSDLKSTSGTAVNGKRIDAEHALSPGDVIQLGEVSLRYEAG